MSIRRHTEQLSEKIQLWIGRQMYIYWHTPSIRSVGNFLALTPQRLWKTAFVLKLNHFQEQGKENQANSR